MNVRTLAEFYYEGGDLESGRALLRRMLAGAQSHRSLQSRYEDGWQSEVAVRLDIIRRGYSISLQGRIDGLKREENHAVVEEIKTTEADVTAMTGEEHPVHWAQAELYAVMLAENENLPRVTVRLCYDQMNGVRVRFSREYDRKTLCRRLETYLEPMLDWLEAMAGWMQPARASMSRLRFPFEGYRAGQRDMAAHVYVALRDGKSLICQAPTGIGKTIAALFPALKALGEGRIERIFYLTARSTGAAAACAALDRLREQGLRTRSVCLTAKDTICPMEERDCRPEACPRARGYYDRRRAALYEALSGERFDRAGIEALADRHTLCPFEMSLDLAEIADVVIGDYNYVFDPRVKLQRFFTGKSQAALLIDEAHNLPARARDMLSAGLKWEVITSLRREIGRDGGRAQPLYKSLTALMRAMTAERGSAEAEEARLERSEELLAAVRRFVDEADELWQGGRPWSAALSQVLFEAMDFLRTGEMDKASYRTLIKPRGKSGVDVTLYCADPAEHIARTLRRVHGAALFSATLTPLPFYRDLFGLTAEDSALIDLPSPFPREHLWVMRYGLPLRYRQREQSLDELCRALVAFVSARWGNYILCFPSYAFMRQTLEHIEWPARVLAQSPGMDETEKHAFLEAVQPDPPVTTLLFIVMGGVFSEGVDLSDNRLTGAAIVGTGVPQISLEGDTLRALYEEKYQSGYAYAYQYPGLARVYQAAGRVIRSLSDRGVVLLLDERWGEAGHRALMPSHWQVRPVQSAEQIRLSLEQFWNTQEDKT